MTQRTFLLCCVLLAGCAGAGGDSSGGDPGNGTGGGGGGGNGGGGGSGSGSGTGDTIDDADANVQPTYPTQHPHIYINARKQELQAALAQSTPAASRFRTVVDSWIGGTDYWGMSAWQSALMGQLTNDPKYCAKAISVVDQMVSDAEAAIASNQKPHASSDSYYFAGGDIGDLALVYDWCFDTVTPSQKTRWLAYGNQTVWNIWHPDAATYGGHSAAWSGWAINDPGNNYYYNFLRATMLFGLAAHGDTPDADQWLTQFHDAKVMTQLVPKFQNDLVGGGSREGTGYGTALAALWELYEFWHTSTGESLAGKTPHARASMRVFVHQIVPTLDRFAPTGDQSRDSTASLFDYQRNYLQELIRLYPHDSLAGPAKGLLANCSVPQMSTGFMAVDDFMYENMMLAAQPLDGVGRTYYAPGIGELYTRSGWDKHATWVNLIAGPYTEDHAHQDQGSLLLYKDGWLGYDAVVNSFSGLPQQTTAHSLVRIDNGGSPVTQVVGTMSKLEALHAGTGWVYAAADVTPAYNGKAEVSRVQREVLYLEPDTVIVYDRVTTAAGTQQTWQFATPVAPSLLGTNAMISGAHALHVNRIAPAGASASVHNMNADSDFNGGYRLDETIAGGDQRYLHVLSIDDAVTSTTPSGDSTVTVQLATGHNVTIAFSHDAIGATLTYDGVPQTLGAGVDAMPE